MISLYISIFFKQQLLCLYLYKVCFILKYFEALNIDNDATESRGNKRNIINESNPNFDRTNYYSAIGRSDTIKKGHNRLSRRYYHHKIQIDEELYRHNDNVTYWYGNGNIIHLDHNRE